MENVPMETTNSIENLTIWTQGLVVKTAEEHNFALDKLKAVKVLKNKVKAFFAPSKEAAAKAHKEICLNEKSFLEKLDEAEIRIKDILKEYQIADQKRIAAEQAKLQAIADEKARKEAAKLEARAAKAEASGKLEKAEALREQAETVEAPVIVVESKANTSGSSLTKTWSGNVIDLQTLIAAATAGTVAASFLMVNQKAVDSFARSTKGIVSVPGVVFEEKIGMAVRV